MLKLLISLVISALPSIGAQVFIEPGQSAEKTEGWFRTMEECGMTTCRIRMFESYMKDGEGNWDFSLFDRAFDCAAAHGIGVWGTFFPETAKTDIGGWKFPHDEAQKEAFATFIRALAGHYKDHPALLGWVLINEPGIMEIPDTPFVREERCRWDASHPAAEFSPEGFPVLMTTSDSRFILDLNTDFLRWIAEQVRAVDPGHGLHVNPHAVYDNFIQYDFPSYRSFLTSLGGSAHASWHYHDFRRDEYAMAILAQSEILRSGAGPLPWWMTEIQGGNNTFSGRDALCPSPEEIRQWLWVVIGCEGKGGIFWMLNPRCEGIEAGEWGMVDFQGKPTGRLEAAAEVAATLKKHPDVFSSLTERPSGIDILYIRESVWTEKLLAPSEDSYEGRLPGAVAKSISACFRALTERGLNAGIKAFEEYDFSEEDFSGKTIILTHQISVPQEYIPRLERFAELGGTIIAEGLTGYYGNDLHCSLCSNFKLENLFGGKISEFILEGESFNVKAGRDRLPVHLWKGSFADSGDTFQVHPFGKGKVVWIPSCIALGAWTKRDFKPLSDFLARHCARMEGSVSFPRHRSGIILRTLDSPKGPVTICINKSRKAARIRLKGLKGKRKMLFSDRSALIPGGFRVRPEGTAVILHEK